MPTKTELDFIRMWFAVAKDGCLPAAEAHDYIVANDISFADHRFNHLVEKARKHHDGKTYRQLSPLGQDLIATAMHVGDVEILPDDGRSPNTKPAPLGTNLVDCRSCEGRGRVPVGLGPARDRTITELVDGLDGGSHDPLERLPGWDVTCTDCKGRGRVPKTLFEVLPKTGQHRTTPRFDTAKQSLDAASDETLDEIEARLRSWIGRMVILIDQRTGGNPPKWSSCKPGLLLRVTRVEIEDVEPHVCAEIDGGGSWSVTAHDGSTWPDFRLVDEPTNDDGWIDVDSGQVAQSLVGKRVEICAPSTKYQVHACHGHIVTIVFCQGETICAMRADGSVNDIWWRGVRVRIVEGSP